MEVVIWTQYYVTRKYLDCMQFYMMLLELPDQILAKDLATVKQLDKDQVHDCLVTRLDHSSAFT